MANTITNFLVGIGLDAKDFKKGSKDVYSELGLIKSRVLLTGAAIAGAFGFAAASVIGTANKIDNIALASAKLDTSAKFVYNYGNALKLLGGDAGESLASLNAVEDALAQFRIKGSFSAFEDPALAGVNVNALSQAKNGEEFLRMLADMLPSLNKDQQRLIQQNFGFSDATMASLRNGSKYFDEMVAKAEKLAPGFDRLVDDSRELNTQWAELMLRMEGLGNIFGEKIIGPLSKLLGATNNFIDNNEKAIEKSVPGGTMVGLGATTGIAGGALSWMGATAIGGAVSSVAIPATVIGGGMIAAALDQKDFEKMTGLKVPKWAIDPYDYMKEGGSTRMLEGLTGRSLKGGKNPYASETVPYGFFNYPSSQKTSQPQEITVNSNLHLDGQVIDSRITKVQVLRDKSTLEDIKTTTAR